ncbi:MAG: dihydropteroate synthase [Thermoleophilaceae bacterium]|nr:dihydropteroate synthase [Thermoleophilaceae bacterium]
MRRELELSGGARLVLEPGEPLLMGVVNASPESFSDGAAVGDLERQVQRARGLVGQGAALIDVGGESGVTGVSPVSIAEETRRVVGLTERLVAEGVVVSVDTWKPEVAEASLAAGAALVNDVSGLRDRRVAEVCAAFGAGLVITHTRAEPKRKEFPDYPDVVADILGFLAERIEIARGAGVGERSLLLDPGPDLGKRPAETISALRALSGVAELGHPILLAVSRKDFIGALTGRPPRERGAGTLAAIGEGVDAGAAVLRVHDVEATADFLAVRAALRGAVEVDPDLALPIDLRRQVDGVV